MRLLAVSDLHVSAEENRRLVAAVAPHPDDWLIIAGDVGDTVEQLRSTLHMLRPKFRQLVWVPGNHDLWTLPSRAGAPRGQQHYLQLVAACRELGVLTPEDPYPTWTGEGGRAVLAPLFLLYDYTFHDQRVTSQEAMRAAALAGVVCTDECLLHPDPYPSREEWCRARVERTAERLEALPHDLPTVLISHFPLRRDLVRLRWVPQFELWCGSTLTQDWHVRYRASVVVYGHLHTPKTSRRDGVRFEEVSLGYPHEWMARRWAEVPLRQVLPAP